MTPDQIDRVFGRGRLKMLTGAHVEVFREAAAPGESRRYTKRFLTTPEGDYAHWTEREWRILARLIGHGTRSVPDVVQYDRGAHGTKLVQTYDAGATVDQWGTLLPVQRDGRVQAHVFEDCAHWWALAHHCLVALDEIHSLQLVHLDVKGDNICIPIGPASFDHTLPGQRVFPVFNKLALIDFAFSLVSGESLTTPLPIGWQQDYDYQSPRLLRALEAGRAGDLQPTEDLDWRCDMYSLAAMLKRYLPGEHRLYTEELACGWTTDRFDAAKALILRLRDAHDNVVPARPPHAELIELTSAQLRTTDLLASLDLGWTLALDSEALTVPALPLTPVTRLARPVRLVIPARDDLVAISVVTHRAPAEPAIRPRRIGVLAAAAAIIAAGASAAYFHPAGREMLMHIGERVAGGARLAAAAMREQPVPGTETDNSAAIETSRDVPVGQPAAAATASEPPLRVDSAAAPVPEGSADAPRAPTAPIDDGRLPATSQASSSLAAQIEAHRPSRSAGPDRAPTKRLQEPARPLKPSIAKSSRPPTSVATRTPTVAASKRNKSTPIIAASRRPAAPVMVATSRAPLPAAAQPQAPSPPTLIEANTPKELPAIPAIASSAPAAAPVLAAPATSSPAAAPPIPPAAPTAPPASVVELPRPAPTPSPQVIVTPGAAPIVEASPWPAPRLPAPRTSPPSSISEDDFFAAQARRLLADMVPQTSARVHARISRALWIAASAHHPLHDRAIIGAASAASLAGERGFITTDLSPVKARRLHEEAQHAYRSSRHVPQAFDLAMKAFGANPVDPDIAGHLAFLHMRIVPADPERARQLALHALGMRNGPHASAAANEWTTFAIASALVLRSIEARNAFYVSLAVTRDAERSCHVALRALESYGERLREPVESLINRLQAQRRFDDSAHCASPSGRLASFRLL